MNEVKKPKKPLLFYYGIMLLILLAFNLLAMPMLSQRRIVAVDYGAFLSMTDLEESIEVVIAGYQKKNAILTDKEKWTVAYHEIGHALVAARPRRSCSAPCPRARPTTSSRPPSWPAP